MTAEQKNVDEKLTIRFIIVRFYLFPLVVEVFVERFPFLTLQPIFVFVDEVFKSQLRVHEDLPGKVDSVFTLFVPTFSSV